MIESWFEGKKIKLERIYRASIDGFTGQAFHSKCDSQTPFLAVVESEHGKRFGGYLSVKLDQGTNKDYTDENAFIFSLTNRTKHDILPNKKNKAYHHYAATSAGMYFGGNASGEMFICNNCDKDGSSFGGFGHTYKLPEGIVYGSE